MTVPENLLGRLIFLVTNYTELILNGIGVTLSLAILGTLFGLVIALLVVYMRQTCSIRIVNLIAKIYIDLIRGTPMMVQATILFYGLANNNINLDPYVAGLIVISFNTSAYIAEIIRSGINSFDIKQIEAAKSLGFSKVKTLRYVVYPQILKNSLPAIMNELVVNVKDSSVLSVIGVSELFYATKGAASEYYLNFEAMILAALIYLVMTSSLTWLIHHFVNRDVSIPTSQTDRTVI